MTTYTYENNRNLITSVSNLKTNTDLISIYSYENDSLGRRTSRVEKTENKPAGQFYKFNYNDRSEVIGAEKYIGTDVNDLSNPVTNSGFNYSFDNIGNRTTSQILGDLEKTYASNELNQYASITDANSSMSPIFDDDGNLAEDSKFIYTWNGENRLIKVTPRALEAGAVELHFVYDYQGRRISKTRSLYNASTMTFEFEKRIEYIFDGWNVILEKEYDLSNAVTDSRKRYWGLDLSGSTQGAGGVGGLLATVEDDAVHYYHYDANGNVTETIDSSGVLTASYEYGPFGELVSQSGTYADENTYRFSTKSVDVETGYYYYGYRHYDPQMGRWLNRDPILEQGFLAKKNHDLFDDLHSFSAERSFAFSRLYYASNRGDKRNETELTVNFIAKDALYRGLKEIYLEKIEGASPFHFLKNNSINHIDLLGMDLVIDERGKGSKIRDKQTGRWASKKDLVKQIKSTDTKTMKDLTTLKKISSEINQHALTAFQKTAATQGAPVSADIADWFVAAPSISTQILGQRMRAKCIECSARYLGNGCSKEKACNKICKNANSILKLSGRLARAAMGRD